MRSFCAEPIGACALRAPADDHSVAYPWKHSPAGLQYRSKSRMAALRPGDKAPDFELPIRSKEAVTLSAALRDGPVVLLTYLFDFSPG